MFGKAKKDGKTKTAFEKKRICDAIVVSFNFFLRVYESVEASMLIKLGYTVLHYLMEFEFNDY